MIFRLRGTKKCTMSGHFVEMAVEKDRLKDAFSHFRRDFPGAGDPHCIGEFQDWKTYEAEKQRERDAWYQVQRTPPIRQKAAA